MKAILVHADHGPGMAGRMAAAAALARRHGGHVTILVNTPFQRFVAMDPFGGAYVAAQVLEDARRDDSELAERLSAELARAGLNGEVVSTGDDLVDDLAEAATLADIVIVSIPAAGDARAQASPTLAGDLAMAGRTAVLALPEAHPALDLDGPVLVAWNGSAEAAAALRAALPLLPGRAVTVLRVGEDEGRIADQAAIDYLARHGVAATLRVEPVGAEGVEETIRARAQAAGATLLVMGAYGHSRLRETLFGGVTRQMLAGAGVPLLLAH